MIANSGYDEHGKYSGGTAGDQTGKEWRIIPYYNRPWNCVLRHNGMTEAFGGTSASKNVSIVRAVPVTVPDWTKNTERNG